MMGRIYERAEKVLICLGEAGRHGWTFIALVQEIGSLADRAARIERAQSMSTKHDNQSLLPQDDRPFGRITDDKWDPLYDISRSPWFTLSLGLPRACALKESRTHGWLPIGIF
jgi:hypothetical protein